MSRVCTVCTHPERKAIDAALLGGSSCRDVAGRYGCSKTSVNRHMEHIQQAVHQAQEAIALDIAKQLDTVNKVAQSVMVNALRDKKTHGLALAASDRILKQLDFQHRVNQLSEMEKEIEALKQALQMNDPWQQ
jgi:transposase-like protein